MSGVDRPARGMSKGSPGQNIVTRTHVEGHAAAHMRQAGIDKATLNFNNTMCPSCVKNIESALPPGARLNVVEGDGTVRTFVGINR